MNLGNRQQAADAFTQLLQIEPDNKQARTFLEMLQKDSVPKSSDFRPSTSG
jgi:predicted TPR repeat methyltransferase